MAGPCSARLQGDVAAFSAALRTLVNNPQFSDVMFVVGQEQQKVFAHRCVLACRCQVFRGMLSQDSSSSIPPQGPFILGNVQPEVFLAVIEFLYTNSVTLNSHIALEVLTSSVEYGLQDLCKLCVKFIKDTLSVEQVCEALQVRVTPVGSQRLKNNLYNLGGRNRLDPSILCWTVGQDFPLIPGPAAARPTPRPLGLYQGCEGQWGHQILAE